MILNWLLNGYTAAELAGAASPAGVELVQAALDARTGSGSFPTVAMISGAAIGESYLRPVDY